MSRIAIPSASQTAVASISLLEAVHKQLGVTPNLMKMIGYSPAALEGYLSLNAALGNGTIGTKTAERIALAITETDDCVYCLSAHSYLAKNVVKLDEVEMAANRNGKSTDVKAAAAVRFATRVAQDRGHVADAELQAVTDVDFAVVHVKSNLI